MQTPLATAQKNIRWVAHLSLKSNKGEVTRSNVNRLHATCNNSTTLLYNPTTPFTRGGSRRYGTVVEKAMRGEPSSSPIGGNAQHHHKEAT